MGIQARVRGFIARLAFEKNIRRLVICQNLVRKYLAKKELKELKIEAMNTTGIETTTAPVSHPTCQVIQTPCALHKEVKHGLEPKPMVPPTRHQCSCRVCITQVKPKVLPARYRWQICAFKRTTYSSISERLGLCNQRWCSCRLKTPRIYPGRFHNGARENQCPLGEPVENKMLNFVWRHLLLMEE